VTRPLHETRNGGPLPFSRLGNLRAQRPRFSQRPLETVVHCVEIGAITRTCPFRIRSSHALASSNGTACGETPSNGPYKLVGRDRLSQHARDLNRREVARRGRHNHYWNLRSRQLTLHGESINTRQGEIEDDQIRPCRLEVSQGVQACRRFKDFKAVKYECDAKQIP
jgi:hypothetical protein